MSQPSTVCTRTISNEDFFNRLYWDHRIYDIRSKDAYEKSHICRAHNMSPHPMISVESIICREKIIDDDYGKSEHPSTVLIYKSQASDQSEEEILVALSKYLQSSSKVLKEMVLLADGFESFQSQYPYLCSDNMHFNESSQLVWPSYIVANLYLGSAMCRNEHVISSLKITHVMSFSDYPSRPIGIDHVKTIHWQIADSCSSDLLSIFPMVVKWILNSIHSENGTVLVHCEQGVSRSASVVIAYLLAATHEFHSVTDALDFVKSKRGVIRPNAGFLRQLEHYLVSIGTRETEEEALTRM